MPPPADRTALLRAKAATLVARIEHGPGVTSPAERQAAAANHHNLLLSIPVGRLPPCHVHAQEMLHVQVRTF